MPAKSPPPSTETEKLAALQNELKETQAELRRKNRFLEHILATLPNLAYIFDLQNKRILFASRTSPSFLGYPTEQLLVMDGESLKTLLHPEDAVRVLAHYHTWREARDGEIIELEFRLKHGHGDWHWFSIREAPYDRTSDGQLSQVLGTAEDVTERMQAQEKLWYATTHDNLTGLYNRPYFREEIDRLQRGRHFPVTVMAVDVDGLRQVNESQGYPAGDALLRNTAELIKSCFRGDDVVARTGGDEFTVLLPDTGVVSIEAVRARVLRHVEAYNNSHPNSPINFSFGFATAERCEELRDMVHEADRRMLANKETNRSRK